MENNEFPVMMEWYIHTIDYCMAIEKNELKVSVFI